jgi:endo-1,4-beta-xylanase
MTTNKNSKTNLIAKIISGILALILAACSLAPAKNTLTTQTQPSLVPNTPTYTATASKTPTVEPTATIKPTPTLVPTKSPEQALAEYLQTTEAKESIDQFVNAMQMAGIEIRAEEMINEFTINEYIIDPSETFVGGRISFVNYKETPLFIYANGEWLESNWKNMANVLGLRIGHHKNSAYTASWIKDDIRPVLADGNIFFASDISYWENPYEENDSLRPNPDSFNFKIINNSVNFTEEKGMLLGGNALLHANNDWLPSWLIEGAKSSIDPRAYILTEVEKHIKGVLKGLPQIDMIAVVAEIDHPQRNVFWRKMDQPLDPIIQSELMTKLGINKNDDISWMKHISWMKQVFDWAHEANPKAKLYYHDFDIEFGGRKADNVFNLVRALKEMGTPIEYIGFQGHFSGKDLVNPEVRIKKMEALAQQIQRYNAIGVEVIVMEFDLRMDKVSQNATTRLAIQAEIQQNIIETLLNNKVKVLIHFSGIDKLSWMEEPERGGPTADPTSFGDYLERKPNYYSEMEAFLNYLTVVK